jgi:poly-beta-1,6-N-acetyl-D-glucosamine synthase
VPAVAPGNKNKHSLISSRMSTFSDSRPTAYVLVTAAYNETAHIEKTLSSVVLQTILPAKWIIVSDGSTDGTDDIVNKYAGQYSFMELLRICESHPRNFAAQVHAINRGINQLSRFDYEFIGNLDADLSFAPTYFEQLLDRFHADPRLGLGGGFICEEQDGEFQSRFANSTASVAHAVQLFRRQCFEDVGAYVPLRYGGSDCHAEVSARMKGWRVCSFPELPVYHHRPSASAGGLLRGWFRQGRMDFSMGSHPGFELAKLARRLGARPALLGASCRLAGFLWSWSRREPRLVSQSFIDFLRKEQVERLQLAFLHPVRSIESLRTVARHG